MSFEALFACELITLIFGTDIIFELIMLVTEM